MRLRRRYQPGYGIIEERVGGEPLEPVRLHNRIRGRKGDFWFNPRRNRIEARGADGKLVGMELPKGN